MPWAKACLLVLAFLALTAGLEPPPAYLACTGTADARFGSAWIARCRSLGRNSNCELSDSEVAGVDRLHLADRQSCLDRFHSVPTPYWWHNEQKRLVLVVSPAPLPGFNRFAGWLISTVVASLCIVGIIGFMRRPRKRS